MLGFHAIVYLFYVVLYVIAGEAGVWRSISGYPVLWISGLIIALIAWLFGHLWILYMIVLISVIILCLALLGLTIGLFGFDLPDTIF